MLGGDTQPEKSVQTTKVIEDWRGQVGLGGYLVALVLALVLYPPNGLQPKALSWGAVGAGLLVAVLAVWLVVLASGSSSSDVLGLGIVSVTNKATVGIGAVLNVVTATAVAVGGLLKVREERLV
jgi:hypothetical protein